MNNNLAGTVRLLSVLLLSYTTIFSSQATTQVTEEALALAKSAIIIDAHVDLPIRLEFNWEDVTESTARGQFDLPRAQAGHLNVPFMSIFVPPRYESDGGGDQFAHGLIDSMEALAYRSPDVGIARSVDDVRSQFGAGKLSLALGLENGTPLHGDLDALTAFYERGVRYITLSQNKSNHICDSSYDEERPWKGLSPFGVELIQAMNDIGMMIDVSHISDQAFTQVLELSRAPVIASHSSARHFTPEFERNMSDDMIRRLAKGGGVISVNYGSYFLTLDALNWRRTYMAREAAYLAESGDPKYGEGHRRYRADYLAANPHPFATIDDVLDHIDHIVQLVGVKHVGIGSDYEGVGDTLPVGLKDVTSYPFLVQGLLDRRYSASDIRMILGENLLRVWAQVEKIAQP